MPYTMPARVLRGGIEDVEDLAIIVVHIDDYPNILLGTLEFCAVARSPCSEEGLQQNMRP